MRMTDTAIQLDIDTDLQTHVGGSIAVYLRHQDK